MPTPNKQPLFAGGIKLVAKTFDPPVSENHYDMSSWGSAPEQVYSVSSTYGDIIDRITITSTGDTQYTAVAAKLIYVYINDGANYSLYKTLVMPATSVSTTTPNPELELVFQGGLLLANGSSIYIGASTNQTNTGNKGDRLSVTIEGGTYDI